jgi:3-hydroxyisobutyrate dehydrogenase-like beta-hydroxyacid dehydrogenase
MGEYVGIVGIGFMGQAFASNLLRAGFSLRGMSGLPTLKTENEDIKR